MISEAEAFNIAEKFIDDHCNEVKGGVAIVKERTIEKPYGWIYFYNAKSYLESGNPLEALGGNGPLVVERARGRVHQLGSAHAAEITIAAFERVHGLRP